MGKDLFEDDQPASGPEDSAGGPGRPKGSQNKHDGKLRDYIAAIYGKTPAMELARRAFMDPADYAIEVGLIDKKTGDPKVGAASSRQERLLGRLLAYTEKKMPTEIEISDEKRVVLQIGMVSQSEKIDEQAASKTIELVPANIRKKQQKQGLSENPVEKSDVEKSDARL